MKLESVHRAQTPPQYMPYQNRTIFEKQRILTDFNGQTFEFLKAFYIFLFRVLN